MDGGLLYMELRKARSTADGAAMATSCCVTAAAVGWSKMSVVGSVKPVACIRRLRSSTALSESKPRSLKARSGSIA